MPDDQKNKCPVCEVKILCTENVRVHTTIERFDLAMEKKLKESIEVKREEAIIGKKKIEEGLNIADVDAIVSYLDIRVRIESVKGNLGPLLASNTTVTPEQQERLAAFLTSMQQYDYRSEERKIAFALFAFNINRETDFTLEDLKIILASTENQIKRHFAAILECDESESEEEDLYME